MASPKVWFVTGCSSGFGWELALLALNRGDRVIATARNASKLEGLKSAGATTMAWDVTAPLAELKKAAAEAHAVYGRFDYLINNAAYNQVGSLEELTPEETQAQFATNVFGLLNTTRAIVPYMRAQRAGVVANFSSVAAWVGYPGVGLYCASKWAVTGLSETLYYELADFNIKVCTIEPGYFRSEFLNPGNLLKRENVIPDYEGTAVRKGEQSMKDYDNNQPGDIKKGVKVIVDVLSGDSGREIPMRLVLGQDAYGMIKAKCEDTIKGLEVWKDLTCSTDLDEQ
ncbi:putative oxidoreductase [Cladophialophora carrionii]|uniref:Putative oxidoreductase n=1 Tax=Cladophialophora carrionii TaxID=86049 RepID=A0A1C1CFM6_9EURO|nr:putative oxidoreductase [Cladophialophora carrionii]